jgi:UDP-3-O-[3-hydroxymyristoyl] glucosamine N-acyltransferase
VVTSNVKIGSFSQINLNCSIGHDTELGDYFTSAPGVNISGSCKIMEGVYFGTNSCVREKVNISSNITIGCGAAVVSNLAESGIYAGVPARRIKNG